MKTCINPNCQTQNIPDEAIYCPACGELLEENSSKHKTSVLTENYFKCQKHLLELKRSKQEFLNFQQERGIIYNILTNFADFKKEIKDSKRRQRRKRTMLIIGVINAVLFFVNLPFIACMESMDLSPAYEDIWMVVTIVMIWLGVSGIMFYYKDDLIYNSTKYISQYIYPFVESHKDLYAGILSKKTSVGKIVEYEICAPNKITTKIKDYIKYTETQIANVENELKILTLSEK